MMPAASRKSASRAWFPLAVEVGELVDERPRLEGGDDRDIDERQHRHRPGRPVPRVAVRRIDGNARLSNISRSSFMSSWSLQQRLPIRVGQELEQRVAARCWPP